MHMVPSPLFTFSMPLHRRLETLAAIAIGISILSSAVPAFATVVTVGYYRLGEEDPGAASGNIGNNPTLGRNAGGVSSPALDLTRLGSPTYTNSVSSTAASSTASNLAVAFNGTTGAYTRNTSLTSVTDNFGIEAWAKRATGELTGAIAVNGSMGDDGWGIAFVDGNYFATYANVAFFDTGVAADTNWHHLALVRNSGVGRVYLDGLAIGSSFNETPRAATVGFGIAADPTNLNFLNGSVDEVRVFTFTAGQFSTSDLLFNPVVPEPSGLALGALGFVGAATGMRRRRLARKRVATMRP